MLFYILKKAEVSNLRKAYNETEVGFAGSNTGHLNYLAIKRLLTTARFSNWQYVVASARKTTFIFHWCARVCSIWWWWSDKRLALPRNWLSFGVVRPVVLYLHWTRSNQNLTSSTTCKRFQPVANFASGCLASLKQNCGKLD